MPFDVAGALRAGYSDREIAEFLGQQQRFDAVAAMNAGYSPQEIVKFLAARPTSPKEAPFSAADIGLSLGTGVLGAGKSLTDVFGAGNVASQALESGMQALQEKMTPERQAEMVARQKKIQEAQTKGTWEEIKAELGAAKEAPLQFGAQALGSLAPALITGVIGGAAKLLPATVRAIQMAVGAAQGAGAVKGSVYDAVADELRKANPNMPDEQVKQQAEEAQSYLGKNWEQILAGAGIGAVAGRFGAESLLTPGAAAKAEARLIPRVAMTSGSEFATEAGQAAQEQLAANIAAQREGFDVPTFRGVAGKAAAEGLAGALGAAPIAMVRGPQAKAPEAQPSAEEVAAPPPTGPKIDLLAPYADLVRQREELRAQEQTPETKEAIDQITRQIKQGVIADVQRMKEEKEQARIDAEKAKESAFGPLAPGEGIQGEFRFPTAQEQQLPPQTDLFGEPVTPPAPMAEPAPLTPAEATVEAKREAREAGQMRLPFRYTAEGEPTSITPPPPSRIYMSDLEAIGVPFRTAKDWFSRNVVNRTKDQVVALVASDPSLVKGQGSRAKILRTLLGPEVPTFKEPVNVPSAPKPTVEPPVQPGGDQRGVGVPSEPTGAAPAAQPKGPIKRGLVPAEQPATPRIRTEGQRTPALTPGKKVDLASAIGAIQGPARPNAPNAPISADDAALLRKMVVKTVEDGLTAGKTRQQIVDQIDALTKGGISPAGFSRINDYLTSRGVKETVTPAADIRTAADLQAEIDSLRNKQSGLLTRKGTIPAPNSKARMQYDAFEGQIQNLIPLYDQKAQAERAREAEDMRVRMAEQQKKMAAPTRTPPAPLPVAPAKPTAPIPETMREPIGTSTYGMPEGEVEIRRGPQAELFPTSKKETLARAEAADRARQEAEAAEAPKAPRATTPEGQMELDFSTKETAPEKVAKPTSPEMAMLDAVNGKPMIEVAQWAAKNLPDPDQRVIAQRVTVALQQLAKLGADLRPVVVTKEGYQLNIGAKGVTLYEPQKNAPSIIRITLNHPSNKDQSGVTPEVVLHELLHAATIGTIRLGRLKSATGTKVGDATTALYELSDAVIKHFNERVRSGAELTEFEKAAYERRNNALRDPDEVLVWALTNRSMQQYLESIPYKGQTAWNKFVTLIRDMLGIPAKADTALSEALRVADTLLDLKAKDIKGAEKATGKQFQVSYSTEQIVDSMGPMNPNQRTGLTQMLQGVKSQAGDPDLMTRFRTQAVDQAAAVSNRLAERFNGAVRDSMGRVNPEGLFRQAQDYSKLLLEYFQRGAIAKDPTTGLWRVTDKKGIDAPAKVYALIDAWSAKHGYSRERGTQIASRILEGVRLSEMRDANRTQGTQFLLHLKDPEIDQLVREYRGDRDLQAMSALMDRARIDLVDHMVAVGRLSPEQGKAWRDVAGYVPFDRLDDFTTKFAKVKKISGKGIAQVGKLPELVGSINRPVGNVFDNYLNTLGWMIRQVTNTDATVATLRTLESMGHAKFLGPSAQQKDTTVGAYVKGELRYWELPSRYDVMAFKDLNPPKATWLRVLGEFSNILRTTVTALPPFALKQVSDDVQRAIFTSGVRNPGPLIRMALTNFPKLALAELRGIQHPIVREFGEMGLTGEYDFKQGKPAESLLKDLGYKKRGKFESLIHKLDGITRASDLAVRKAIYDQTLVETNDRLLAETRAREFINFRRRGASDFVGAMVTTIPFFNAYAQGMDVLYRAATGKGSASGLETSQARKLFWSRAAIVTAFAALYAMGKADDEDYTEMDLRTRDGNWILPGGYKIPVPSELGAIFKVIPERVVEYYKRKGTPEEQEAFEAVRTAMAYIAEQYVGRMVPVPQAAKPLLEAWTNYSFLTGRPLEGIYQKAQLPSARRGAGTSELAIAIANFSRDTVGVEISPIMIDNTLRGYFGSTAAMTTMVTDSLLNPDKVDRPLHKWALLSNYLYDPVGTRRMDEFYETREKVGQINTTLNELAKTDMARAEIFADQHESELQLAKAVNSTLNQLEQTRAYRKYLNSPEGAADMAKAERESELESLRKYEVELVGWLREAKTEIRNMRI